MTTQRRDADVLRGETYSQDFVWQDEDGARVNLSGISLAVRIRDRHQIRHARRLEQRRSHWNRHAL